MQREEAGVMRERKRQTANQLARIDVGGIRERESVSGVHDAASLTKGRTDRTEERNLHLERQDGTV